MTVMTASASHHCSVMCSQVTAPRRQPRKAAGSKSCSPLEVLVELTADTHPASARDRYWICGMAGMERRAAYVQTATLVLY